MKLTDQKLSELQEICSKFKCFQCPLWDEQMDCCFFAVSRIPCQWNIKSEDETIDELEKQVEQYQNRIDELEERICLLESVAKGQASRAQIP